jgi:hypothetical protein
MVMLLDSTVSVTTRRSVNAPSASDAAIALVSRDDASGAGRPSKPAGPPFHGLNPSGHERITRDIRANLPAVTGNIAAPPPCENGGNTATTGVLPAI